MSAQPPVAADIVVLGKIVSAYGLRGAVHVHPFADDPAAWARMKYWWLGREGEAPERWQPQRLIRCRAHGDSWVAQFAGFDDRNAAEAAAGLLIGAPREALPATGTDEYYWGDLIGLEVRNAAGVVLGKVTGLLSTGAHDVLQIQDGDTERLIPFVASYVGKVDVAAGVISVEWEADW